MHQRTRGSRLRSAPVRTTLDGGTRQWRLQLYSICLI